MKIGRKGLIFLLAVIILAGAVTLFLLYRGQMKEQDRLNTELEGKNTSIQLLTIRQHSLEADIAALEADIAAARGETGQLEAEITQKQAELGRLEDERARTRIVAPIAGQLLSPHPERLVGRFVDGREVRFLQDRGLLVGFR